jgi:hypothetical protein
MTFTFPICSRGLTKFLYRPAQCISSGRDAVLSVYSDHAQLCHGRWQTRTRCSLSSGHPDTSKGDKVSSFRTTTASCAHNSSFHCPYYLHSLHLHCCPLNFLFLCPPSVFIICLLSPLPVTRCPLPALASCSLPSHGTSSRPSPAPR